MHDKAFYRNALLLMAGLGVKGLVFTLFIGLVREGNWMEHTGRGLVLALIFSFIQYAVAWAWLARKTSLQG
ncbi:MAG: hypothetical protein J5I41_02020 [Saprospiraceae bacterium]|nr:hypothetical protein [Saprospiraceae bacterium]